MPFTYGGGDLDARGMHVAVVVSTFNDQITHPMLQGALDTTRELGVADDDGGLLGVRCVQARPGVAERLAGSRARLLSTAAGALVCG